MRRIFAVLAAAGLLSAAATAAAEPRHVAIVNFGEHPALQLVVDGLKESMAERGFVEGEDVRYTFDHVNWERNLIPQMLAKVAADKPDVVVTITTPVTQTAVRAIQDGDIPIVFSAVQDPVVAGVIPAWDQPTDRITGASNLVDMDGTIRTIKEFIPGLTRLGLPYNPGDDADNALRERLVEAAPKYGVELELVAVDNVNDLPQRLQAFDGKVQAIYVIPSNLFQPATAQIGAIADRMGIPAFNGLPAPVEKHQMLASYSVDWPRIGANTAAIVERIFAGEPVASIKPSVPTPEDHDIVVSGPQLAKHGLSLPAALEGCGCVIAE